MTKAQLESRVIGVLERIVSGKGVEDSHVECKTDWPVPDAAIKTARQIAGLANAAAWEPVVWIIGADEKGHKVPGATACEVSTWWGKIKALFDGTAPRLLQNSIIGFHGVDVVALEFETDSPPYVVRRDVSGTLEAPWREGNDTRSASRSELLRMLLPMAQLPEAELLRASLDLRTVQSPVNMPNVPMNLWSLSAQIYFVPQSDRRLVAPFHRCSAIWRVSPKENWRPLRNIQLGPTGPSFLGSLGPREEHPFIRSSGEQVQIDGPGMLVYEASSEWPKDHIERETCPEISFSILFAGQRQPLFFTPALGLLNWNPGVSAHWACGQPGDKTPEVRIEVI